LVKLRKPVPASGGRVELVKNNYLYWEFIRNLRNLEGVREGFIQQEIITQEQQQAYMSQYNDYFYICLYKGKPAGYIGVIDNDIRVATHPDYQGKGVGSFMVKQIKKLQPSSVAKVKIDNKASLGLFKKCGFEIKYYLLE
jgi:GNAT superfamily N-acetyltransferase